jgi:hypothetical protein
MLTFEFKRGCIDGPPITCILDLTFECPGTLDGIIMIVLDNIDPVRGVVACIGSEVDVPLVAPSMKFGRPQLFRPLAPWLRYPHRLCFCVLKVCDIRPLTEGQIGAG